MSIGSASSDRYCLNCGTENTRSADLCRRCGRRLRRTVDDETRGAAFVLNELETLRDERELGDDVYLRLRDRYLPILRRVTEPAVRPAAPQPAPPTPVAPSIAPARHVSPMPRVPSPAPRAQAQPRREGPGWLAEQQANLLLYLGAFLIVIAALVYVGYSGNQSLNDSVKMALLSAYTLFFLLTGVLCIRSPRVKQAGLVFFALGSLMVPINFVGAYGFFFADDNLDPTGLWLAGSICSALFYAATSYAGFGKWYSIPMIVAAYSSLVAALTLSGAPIEAYPGSFIALSFALALPYLLPLGKFSETFGPTGAIVANAVIPLGLLTALVLTTQTSRPDGEVLYDLTLRTRWYFPPTVAIAALFYWTQALAAGRVMRQFEESLSVIALAVSGAAAVALVYALDVGYQWYGPAVAIVGLVYGTAGVANSGWKWAGNRHLSWMALSAITVSWLCFEGVYKDFPAHGAGVHFAAGAFYLAAARLTNIQWPVLLSPASGEQQAKQITIGTSIVLAWVAALVLGIAVYDVLLATRDASAVQQVNAVWPFFGLSLGIAAVAATMRWWWPELKLHMYAIAFAMSLFVLLTAANADGQVTLLLSIYTVVALALTLWDKEPLGLALPAGYGFFALLAGWRLYEPDDLYLPIALSGAAATLFIVSALLKPLAARLSLNEPDASWARVLQAVAFIFAMAAPVAGAVRVIMLFDLEESGDSSGYFATTAPFMTTAIAVALLACAGGTTRWWWRELKLPVYGMAIAMSALVLLGASNANGQVTVILSIYGAAALGLTLWERQPLALVLPAAYGYLGLLAGWRLYEPIDAYLPIVLSATAGALFATSVALAPAAKRLGLRAPSEMWATVLQALAFAFAIAAPATGGARLAILVDEAGFVGSTSYESTGLFQTIGVAVALVGIAAATTRWWWREVKLPVYSVALAMSIVMVLSSTESVGMTAVLLLGYGTLALALTLWENEPLGLAVPGGFGLFALLAAWWFYELIDAYLPLAVSGVGIGLFLVALSIEPAAKQLGLTAPGRRWSNMVEALAFFFAAAAPVIGWSWLAMLTEHGFVDSVHFEVTGLYQTSAAAVALIAVLLFAKAHISRRIDIAALGSALAMVAGLLQVGHFGPDNLQAYTAPLGVYILAMALLSLRVRVMPNDVRAPVPAIELLGAALIMGPSFVQSLDADGWRYGAILLAEGIGFVVLALVQRRIWLMGAATTFVVMDAAHYLFFAGGPALPNWAILAIAGTAVMGAGTAILFGRESWTAWQEKLQSWWYRNQGESRDTLNSS